MEFDKPEERQLCLARVGESNCSRSDLGRDVLRDQDGRVAFVWNRRWE